MAHYGQALVTNYYQFVLVTWSGQTGQPVIEERYDIAANANSFWEAAKQPRALAQKHAPAYRLENAGALRQDWPRVPLPTSRAAVEASAVLGRQVAALLDVETPVSGVTQGDPRDDLRTVAI